MLQLLSLCRGLASGRGRQYVHTRPVKKFLLQTAFTFTLRKLFVRQLPVKGHYARRKFFQFLGKHNTALGEILARKLFRAVRGTLDQVGQTDAELDDALVVAIIEWFRHNAAFEEHGPELVLAPGVVVADTDRRLGRMASHNHKFHPLSEM